MNQSYLLYLVMAMSHIQCSQQSYTDITSLVHRPPKSLPKKGGILLLKGDPRSPYKSIMPVLLGMDLNIGGLCTGEVISV